MEQTLVTDQDNALIMEGPKEAFLEFADRVNRDLDACGFPLCKGDIMARNPRWCLTLQEWRSVFDGWIRNNDPGAAAREHLLRFPVARRRGAPRRPAARKPCSRRRRRTRVLPGAGAGGPGNAAAARSLRRALRRGN